MGINHVLWRSLSFKIIRLLLAPAFAGANDVLVANETNSTTKPDSILRFNSTTGALIGSFLNTPVVDPVSMTYGPDGNLYIASSATHSITRYEGQSGLFID